MSEPPALGAAHLARHGDGRALEIPRYARRFDRRICHLGIGRFHRAHLANYLHRLLQQQDGDGWGLCAIGLRAEDRPVLDALQAQDGLYTLWETDGNSLHGRVIGSIMQWIDASADADAGVRVLADPATRIVSLTVTEAGYCLDGNGRLDVQHADIVHDRMQPLAPRSAPGLIVRALALRHAAGGDGLTLMSCDNLIDNGGRLRAAVLDFAASLDPALAAWIDRCCSFPCSMVDRITPMANAERDRERCAEWGVRDAIPVRCETWSQWILEDAFVAGCPAFERVGVVLSDQVPAYEALKVGLLNGGHSALAHLGLMQGHVFVHEAMADPLIQRWLSAYMRDVAATLAPPVGVDVAAYSAELLRRFANPELGDRLSRLAQDTSAKFQQTLLPPLHHHLQHGESVELLALALALWIRYLASLRDDAGADTAYYHDVARHRLLPLACAATAQLDARAFLDACLTLPPQHAATTSSAVERHLDGLRHCGNDAHVTATVTLH